MNIAMVLAGGTGTRLGGEIPKQFIDIHGKPLIIYTLERFDTNPNIDAIVVMCKEEWKEELLAWIKEHKINKVKWILDGGDTRQGSVSSGMKMLEGVCEDDDVILIHDCARPLISQRIIDDNIKCAEEFGAANTAIPSTDTIIRSIDAKTMDSVPPRSELYLVQTPQSFKYSIICKAHRNAIENNIMDATDDSQLVLKLGHDVHIVNGDKLNFKVTTQEDLLMLKSIIKHK